MTRIAERSKITKVVLIGDSIRMGYQPLVVTNLQGWAEVWGPSENCRHSLWALEHFNQWVAGQRPDILHFNFGIHDAELTQDGHSQIVIEQYRLCLQRFIKRAEQLHIRLIWATTTPRYQVPEGNSPGQWLKMTRIDDYNAAALQIVRSCQIAVNDLHKAITDNDYVQCLQSDGCHMSDFGNKVLADAVVKSVGPFL